MKKFFLIYLFCIAMACLSSCSSVDNDECQPLAITQSLVEFDANGGEGYISLNGTSGITSINSSESWCAVSYSGGSTVNLKTSVNPQSYSRNAVITVTDEGGSEIRTAVSQRGSVYKLGEDNVLNTSYAGTSAKISIASHNVDADLIPNASWLSAIKAGEQIVVSTSDNNTGTWRTGTIYCSVAGNIKDSIVVVQLEKKDIYGEYYMTGTPYITSDYDNFSSLLRVNLSESDSTGTVQFSLPDYDISFALDYDDSTNEFTLPAGSNILKTTTFVMDNCVDGYLMGDSLGHYETTSLLVFDLLSNGSIVNEGNSCNAYLSTKGQDIIWVLKANGSSAGSRITLSLLYDQLKTFYLGASLGYYFAANNPYLIKVESYHSSD